MFPICGALQDDSFTYNGKEYHLEKHGYIRFLEFVVEERSETSIVFLHTSDEETLQSYPFSYELRVKYELEGNSIKVTYKINNTQDAPMYFSISAHEGYDCPGGIEDFTIFFDQEETLKASVPDGEFLKAETVTITEKSKEFPLANKYSFCDWDALVFKKFNSSSAILKRKGREVMVDFSGFEYLVIWSKPSAPYICIEPWFGIQPAADGERDITLKEGIQKLDGLKSWEKTHIITCKG